MRSQTDVKNFYKNKKVLITGVHGFKGAWLAMLLHELGAKIIGVGLTNTDDTLLYSKANVHKILEQDIRIDIRDRAIIDVIKSANPDIVFHLAAQPIVSKGYSDPYLTYTSNVIGTLNIFEGVRAIDKKVSFVNITTDKVYKNLEKDEGYKETDELMGTDPYSSSKSCAELVAYSYTESFLKNSDKVVSNVRAGNVVGGGDFSADRIIPDLVKAIREDSAITIRNFDSVRPYQHVLDAVYAYILVGLEQYENPKYAGNYNIGPNDESIMTTEEIVLYFQSRYPKLKIIDASSKEKMKETKILKLDSNKIRNLFEWSPKLASRDSILSLTYDWYVKDINGADSFNSTMDDIKTFLNS